MAFMSFLLLFCLIDCVCDSEWINTFARGPCTAHTIPSKTLPNVIHSHETPCVTNVSRFFFTKCFAIENPLPLPKPNNSKLKSGQRNIFSFDMFSIPIRNLYEDQKATKNTNEEEEEEKKLALALYTAREKKLFTKSVACFAPFVNLELCAFSLCLHLSLFTLLWRRSVCVSARVRSRTHSCSYARASQSVVESVSFGFSILQNYKWCNPFLYTCFGATRWIESESVVVDFVLSL